MSGVHVRERKPGQWEHFDGTVVCGPFASAAAAFTDWEQGRKAADERRTAGDRVVRTVIPWTEMQARMAARARHPATLSRQARGYPR